MATTTFYPDADPESTSCDGRCYIQNGTSWDEMHDRASSQGALHAEAIQNIQVTATDRIYRAFSLFDTSALSGYTVSAATLSLYVTVVAVGDNDGNDFFAIVSGTTASNTSIAVGDYDTCGDAIDNPTEMHDSGDRLDLSSEATTSAYNDFVFNATGIANINTSGISNFGHRLGHDIVDSAPSAKNEMSWYGADQADTTTDPKLVVSHTPLSSISDDYSTNLISYWALEEASGDRLDSHTGGNDLADNNTVGQGTGIQDSCADFEVTGTPNEYLSITDANQTSLNPSGAFSISFWFKPESIGTYWLIGRQGGDISINYGVFMTATALYFRRSTGGTLKDAIYTTTLVAGTWYHIIATFDTTNGMIMYVDGTSQATETNTGGTDVSAQPMTIGARDRGTPDVYYDGLIDEVGFWNGTALSSTDVTGIYNLGSGIPYEISDVAYNSLSICNF